MKNLFTSALLLGFALFSNAQTSGGPDAYGYTWRDSNDPNGPAFDWVDITTVGTPITGLTDDNASGFITMGMSFHYYWSDITKLIVGSNGWLGFSPTSNIAHCFPTIPLAGGAADHYLAPLMTDLLITQPGFSADVYYYFDQTNERFIVSYIDVPWWNVNSPGYLGSNTFQVILSAQDSSITYQYLDVDQVNLVDQVACDQDLVVGIENLTGDIGLQVYQEQVPADNYAIKFYYPEVVTFSIKDAGPQWNQNVQNKGQFVPSQTNFNLQTGISNFGNADITTTIDVSGTLSDLNSTNVFSSSDALPNLAAGGISTIVFGTQANLSPGQYSFRTETINADDINPGNNTNISEINAVDMSQGSFMLSYATQGFPQSQILWSGGDGGAGVFIQPPSYPVYLDSVAVFITDFGGSQNFRIEVYDDDQGPNIPGTQLALENVSGTSYVTNSWVNVPLSSPIEITSGGVYIGWIHVTGSTIALGGEQVGPISRQSYEYIGGNWAVYRENEQTDLLINGYFTTQCGSFSVNTESIGQVSCYGGADGSVDVSVSGGSGNYTFNWDNNVGAVEDPSGLEAGVYQLTVSDDAGCTASISATINQPSEIEGSGVITNATQGNNGAIDLSPSGGNPPYTFSWSNGFSTEDITGLAPGSYTVSVFDATNCEGTFTFEVEDQVGIQELNKIQLELYPNPNNGEFTIVGDFRGGQFQVLDLTGRAVSFTLLHSAVDRSVIELTDATPGLFLLNWVDETSIGNMRFSVVR